MLGNMTNGFRNTHMCCDLQSMVVFKYQTKKVVSQHYSHCALTRGRMHYYVVTNRKLIEGEGVVFNFKGVEVFLLMDMYVLRDQW